MNYLGEAEVERHMLHPGGNVARLTHSSLYCHGYECVELYLQSSYFFMAIFTVTT
jgi:hypothetical protein